MTWYFSYIGDLDDPDFHWDNPAEVTKHINLPRRLVPTGQYMNIGASVFFVMKQIESGERDAKQLDWGAWGVRMTGRELGEYFGADHSYAAAIAALDPARDYVLVAGEGG